MYGVTLQELVEMPQDYRNNPAGFLEELSGLRELYGTHMRNQKTYFLPHYPSFHAGVPEALNRSWYRLDPRDETYCGITYGLILYVRQSIHRSFRTVCGAAQRYYHPYRYHFWPLVDPAPEPQFHPLGWTEFKLDDLPAESVIELFAGEPFDSSAGSASLDAKAWEAERVSGLILARRDVLQNITFEVGGWYYSYKGCVVENDGKLKIILAGKEAFGQEYIIQW